MPSSEKDLRLHAETLQREVDRRILVEQDLARRLEDQTQRGLQSEQVFRLLVESVRDYAIFMLDREGNVATWNGGAQRIKGYTASEIIGRHFSTFYPETDVRAGKCDFELAVAARVGRFEEEGWRVRKDGTQFWANVVISAVHDASGRLVGFAKVTRDLTERKLGEEQRRSEEQRFRLLIESVEDYAIFMLDPQGKIVTWNIGAERIKGYKAPEVIGRHFSIFYPDVDVRGGKCERELEGATRTGRFEDEGWRLRKDGSRFWANVVITALRDPAGTLIGFGKVTRDLTERKRAEEKRRILDARFRMLVDSVRDYAIFILDPDGKVATWNAGAERIKGYSADEIIGTHFSRFYPLEDVQAGKCELELEGATRTGRFEDEGWRLRKDGSRFWANVVINSIHDDLGKLVGFSKVTRDLTERKRADAERTGRLAAEQANRTKDEFLAMLGHELRNPLAPILSALQLLKLRGDSKSVREHQIIERQVRQMVRLVDDLLDISRISRGKIELQRRSIDLRDALAKAVEIAIPLYDQKAQHLEIEVAQEPLPMQGDETRLVQVFANLLNNASKYTPPDGTITMAVRKDGDHWVVEVSDTGIGINPTLLPRVFELFVQGYQEADRAAGGLGIGLTLVRSLVELHGGQVEARSAGVDKGSTFSVRLPVAGTLPAAMPEAPLATAVSPPVLKVAERYRILIVDDNDDARVLISDILVALGYEVKSAGDGPSALEQLRHFAPQFAILDIGLPGMDGYELADRIRQTPGGEKIRLVALSGYGQPLDHEQSTRSGFHAHLVKPVELHRILAQLTDPMR